MLLCIAGPTGEVAEPVAVMISAAAVSRLRGGQVTAALQKFNGRGNGRVAVTASDCYQRSAKLELNAGTY